MKRTVLIVEDNDSFRKALVRMVEYHGFNTLEADTGTSAAEILDMVPDAILLDLMLPGMPGDEILRMIRAKGLKTRVVMMTGSGDEKRIDALKSMNPDVVLRKPFGIEELIVALSRHS